MGYFCLVCLFILILGIAVFLIIAGVVGLVLIAIEVVQDYKSERGVSR